MLKFIKSEIAKLIVLLIVSLICVPVYGQTDVIEFDSDKWDVQFGRVEEYLGRNSFYGRADLRDVEFENGVIEYDVAFEGDRCFAGVLFRVKDAGNAENFYMRPHKSNLPDALQFQSIINGQSSWQLYSNEGFIAAAKIPHKQWIHVKMEVSGKNARIFLDNSEEPAIVIRDLKRGVDKGGITVAGPGNRLAHFANFKYRIDESLVFDDPPIYKMPFGMITDWEVSEPVDFYNVDMYSFPDKKDLNELEWKKAECEHTGLVNIARYFTRPANVPFASYVRTYIDSDIDELRRFNFGYSDVITIFLNGREMFTGFSDFRRRDELFLGTVGLFDFVYLPLKKGRNELIMTVVDVFGGWGFLMKDAEAVYTDESIEKAWETGKKFKFPESAVYDKKRNSLYITNFDQYYPSSREAMQSISKLTINGDIVEMEWVKGFFNPTGMQIFNDKLYVVDRRGVSVVDIDKREIEERYTILGQGFLNDIAVDRSGIIYVSDSQNSVLYRIVDGKPEKWLTHNEIVNLNGLFIRDDRLIFGNGGDSSLKYLDLKTKEIGTIIEFEPGIIDGIKVDNNGNYIVTLFEGKIYRITPGGQITKLLDTTAPGFYAADFEYIPELNMLIVPTMGNGVVKAYIINDGR
ncbi:SMP-30/gluconolactonase/LRE family protein [candidate division KSB1 bacterium]